MKITKRQLRRIIKEEKARILLEAGKWDEYDEYGNPKDGPKIYGPDAAASGIADAVKQMTSKRGTSQTPRASGTDDAIKQAHQLATQALGPAGDLPGGEQGAQYALMDILNVLTPFLK